MLKYGNRERDMHIVRQRGKTYRVAIGFGWLFAAECSKRLAKRGRPIVTIGALSLAEIIERVRKNEIDLAG